MTPKLPPLPRTEARLSGSDAPVYDEDDLEAYGLACWKQGMERAAKICDGLADGHQFIRDSRAERIADDCADAIRKEITP